jgi:hypothetical protein
MKKYLQLSLITLFFITNNPYAHAVIETHPQQAPPQYKSTFLQKISLKITKKRLKKHFKTTDPTETKSKGDKIAAYGLWTVISTLALFFLALLIFPNSAILGISILFMHFSGLVASIAALTRKDLSKKGKTMALWGVCIVAFELILVTLTLVLAYFSY